MNFDLTRHKIAVLMGGPGSERAVSMRSGEGVVAALQSLGADVVPVVVDDPDFELPADTTIAFNAIHGTFGEDGQVQREPRKPRGALHRRRGGRERTGDRQDREQTMLSRARRADRAI